MPDGGIRRVERAFPAREPVDLVYLANSAGIGVAGTGSWPASHRAARSGSMTTPALTQLLALVKSSLAEPDWGSPPGAVNMTRRAAS